jgi:hypothetical protein
MGQLVLDQRVIEDEKIGKAAVLGHGGGASGARGIDRDGSAHRRFPQSGWQADAPRRKFTERVPPEDTED